MTGKNLCYLLNSAPAGSGSHTFVMYCAAHQLCLKTVYYERKRLTSILKYCQHLWVSKSIQDSASSLKTHRLEVHPSSWHGMSFINILSRSAFKTSAAGDSTATITRPQAQLSVKLSEIFFLHCQAILSHHWGRADCSLPLFLSLLCVWGKLSFQSILSS